MFIKLLRIYISCQQVMKVEDEQTVLDSVYESQLRAGEDKYSTLRRTRSGNTQSRVAFFEEL